MKTHVGGRWETWRMESRLFVKPGQEIDTARLPEDDAEKAIWTPSQKVFFLLLFFYLRYKHTTTNFFKNLQQNPFSSNKLKKVYV